MISEILTGALTIGKTHLYSYWFYNGIAYLLAMLSAVLPAYLIVKKELFLNAAQLLLPKPPSKGQKSGWNTLLLSGKPCPLLTR